MLLNENKMGDGTKLHYSKMQVIHVVGRFEVWLPPLLHSRISAYGAGHTPWYAALGLEVA